MVQKQETTKKVVSYKITIYKLKGKQKRRKYEERTDKKFTQLIELYINIIIEKIENL